MLWLAIDDGSGPRLVGLKQVNAARPALNRAIDRGYRLGLPGGTAAEQAAVGAIWRGDTAAVARASSAYSPPMQLVGKLYRSEGGWTADWTFVDGGKVLSTWSATDADARKLMTSGADGAADALIRATPSAAPAGLPGTYRVIFTGIDSSDDFMRLSGYLQKLQVVRKTDPGARLGAGAGIRHGAADRHRGPAARDPARQRAQRRRRRASDLYAQLMAH